MPPCYQTLSITESPWAEAIAIAETEGEARRIAAASPYKKDVIVGTPMQVAEQLQPFVDLGVEYLIVRVVDFPAPGGVDLFAHEVMPRLRAVPQSYSNAQKGETGVR